MAKDQRQVDAITARDVDFAQWFTDVCRKAELIDYSSIKGMFIYRSYSARRRGSRWWGGCSSAPPASRCRRR